MTRNKAVQIAQENKCDFLFMIDSDMHPDYVPGAPPFWDVAFDFAYDRLLNNQPTVIAAPYCGPPTNVFGQGESNTYVFRWYEKESDSPTSFDLRFLSRSESLLLRGIQPMAALPTGLILYSLSAFSLMEPPYFKYEFKDKFESEKYTTEDVYNTREISIAGALR